MRGKGDNSFGSFVIARRRGSSESSDKSRLISAAETASIANQSVSLLRIRFSR